MNVATEADKVRYIVTGEGGLDLRGEKLTMGQACDRLMRAQKEGPVGAVVITPEQQLDWAMSLRAARMDYLLGVPLVVIWPSA